MIALGALLVVIVLEEIAEAIYRRTNKYERAVGLKERFKNVPDGIEVCNIGSGPGLYAISYENSRNVGFNFSTAPQNFKYGFRLLKRYCQKIQKGATVIIVVMAPLSFGKNNDYDRKDYNDMFYGILPKEDIDNYSLKRLFIVTHPLLLRVLKKFYRMFFYKRQCVQSANSGIPTVVTTWKREFDLLDLKDASQEEKHREAFAEKIQILQDGIEYCYQMGWNPILVTPPIPSNTRSYISDEFVKKFVYDNVRQLLINNPKLRYLNYFDDKYPDELFMNDIFMNKQGREFFSMKLKREIQLLVDADN